MIPSKKQGELARLWHHCLTWRQYFSLSLFIVGLTALGSLIEGDLPAIIARTLVMRTSCDILARSIGSGTCAHNFKPQAPKHGTKHAIHL